MKTFQILFTLLLVGLFFTTCKKEDTNDETSPITVSGIDFKPNFFLLDGKIVGIDADIASQAMQTAMIPTEFTMTDSWDEAYQATLTGPERALLTVAYTNERKDLFKWAGPTSKSNYDIFAKASSGVGAGIGVEASKAIVSIAVVDGWNETTILEDLGFNNLQYYNTYGEAINAFKNDEVKAIASDRTQLGETLTLEYYMQQQINPACIYHTAFYFIAFSKDIDDQLVSRCQSAIDAMKTNGNAFFELYRGYVPYASPTMVPGLIQLTTEIDPPFNYVASVSGADFTLDGSAVEIITEMQSQSNYKELMNISSWAVAYKLLQFMPNYALFTTARTPEREDLFQWVGPISSTTACFYTKTASGIQIQTLEQAKALGAIATPQGWFSHDFLIENGFQNILATAYTSEEAFNQLISGEADALLLYETGVKWLCDKTGIPQTDLSKQLEIAYYKDYIAFSLSTPSSVVAQWQSNLDAIKANGRFETIWNSWYEGIPMP